MKKLEKIFLSLVLGAILPIIGFLAGWWSLCKFASNGIIALAAFGGLGIGLVLDAVFLQKWVAQAYEIPPVVWMAVYLFYSICVFGFFMGVPIFNVMLALPAGIFLGGRFAHTGIGDSQERSSIQGTQVSTTLVMGAICASSAFLALRDPTTAANLEGMLRLNFTVTSGMIVGLIVVGGTSLLLLQWWLTEKSVKIGRWMASQN